MDEDDMLMLGVGAEPTQHAEIEDSLTGGVASDPTMINDDPTAVNAKVRRPQVKLTAERLLSPNGLPYVMKHAPKRVRISKSRSTYENLEHIIQFYQLWAHELFPKAKFKDFVRLCNSLGKTDADLRNYRTELFRADMENQFGDGYRSDKQNPANNSQPVTSTQLPNNDANSNDENNNVENDTNQLITGGQETTRHLFARDEEEDDDSDLYRSVPPPSSIAHESATSNTHAVPTSDTTLPISDNNPKGVTNSDGTVIGISEEDELLAMEEELNNYATQKIEELGDDKDTGIDPGEEEDEDALDAMKELGF
ncbi:Replication Fork Protection Component Swi3 [Nakaseomyces glabratus]